MREPELIIDFNFCFAALKTGETSAGWYIPEQLAGNFPIKILLIKHKSLILSLNAWWITIYSPSQLTKALFSEILNLKKI